jgi:O-antigen ligase
LLRTGAWETGLLVIKAHPLTGVGLSLDTYFERAEPYRVALQDTRLTQPHNSFLEIAALGGLPILLLFIAILGRALRLAIANFRQASVHQQTLIGGAFACVATLTFNSFVVNAWTLAPLAVIGWLVLGAISSPGLARSLGHADVENT